MRSVDPLVFCKYALRAIEAEEPNFVVISDVRVAEEYAFFLAHGFAALRLAAPLEIRVARGGFDAAAVSDVSERDLADVRPVVWNVGSVAELQGAVDLALLQLFPAV